MDLIEGEAAVDWHPRAIEDADMYHRIHSIERYVSAVDSERVSKPRADCKQPRFPTDKKSKQAEGVENEHSLNTRARGYTVRL